MGPDHLGRDLLQVAQDLPVQGADRIDLAVNLKTSELLGLTVPRKILLRADAFRR